MASNSQAALDITEQKKPQKTLTPILKSYQGYNYSYPYSKLLVGLDLLLPLFQIFGKIAFTPTIIPNVWQGYRYNIPNFWLIYTCLYPRSRILIATPFPNSATTNQAFSLVKVDPCNTD